MSHGNVLYPLVFKTESSLLQPTLNQAFTLDLLHSQHLYKCSIITELYTPTIIAEEYVVYLNYRFFNPCMRTSKQRKKNDYANNIEEAKFVHVYTPANFKIREMFLIHPSQHLIFVLQAWKICNNSDKCCSHSPVHEPHNL